MLGTNINLINQSPLLSIKLNIHMFCIFIVHVVLETYYQSIKSTCFGEEASSGREERWLMIYHRRRFSCKIQCLMFDEDILVHKQ